MVTDVFGFVDVLISFWGQRSKIKVTAGNSPKNRVNTVSLYIFSPKIGSCMYLRMRHTDEVKRSKVTAVGGITVDGSPSSSIYTVFPKVVHPTDGDNFAKT